MRELLRVVGAFAILMLLFFVALFVMDRSGPRCSLAEALVLRPPFTKFGVGFAYVAEAPSLASHSDTLAAQTESRFLICEDGYLLGPPHSVHAEIDAKGEGRFSHWDTAGGFVFSASNNSDPNTNGKRYRAGLEKN
jgi:hypothetical protein